MRRIEQQGIKSSGLSRLLEAPLSGSGDGLRDKHSASQELQPQAPNGHRLPLSEIRPVPRRGLSRVEAALYVGVSPSLFDEMVKDGRMPKPRRINSRTVWDKRQLDEAFDALPGGENSGDEEDWNVAV